MTSSGIALMEQEIEARDKNRVGDPPPVIVAMWDAHDAWVNDDYRLLALSAELDAEGSEPASPPLRAGAELSGYFDDMFAA